MLPGQRPRSQRRHYSAPRIDSVVQLDLRQRRNFAVQWLRCLFKCKNLRICKYRLPRGGQNFEQSVWPLRLQLTSCLLATGEPSVNPVVSRGGTDGNFQDS